MVKSINLLLPKWKTHGLIGSVSIGRCNTSELLSRFDRADIWVEVVKSGAAYQSINQTGDTEWLA